jgi:hypothetical protein
MLKIGNSGVTSTPIPPPTNTSEEHLSSGTDGLPALAIRVPKD